MSNTIRAYNKKDFISHVRYSDLEYHPYKQQDRHKCSYCYDWQKSKHRRLVYKQELRNIWKHEVN